MHRSTLLSFLIATSGIAAERAVTPGGLATGRTPISYAQLLADTVAFENGDVARVELYSRTTDSGVITLVAQAGASTDAIRDAAAAARSNSSQTTESGTAATGVTTVLPLLDITGAQIGTVALRFAPSPSASPGSALARSAVIRDELKAITPKRETLFDPYIKGYDATDTLAQRINQILVARHPDAATIAIHLTAPGDTKNRVWGINRPNFIGRDSDEIDTDTEKTGRIVMQVIPATHRMEVHMPLLAPHGGIIGTLCTVYLWRSVSETADFYGRSLSMMEEARQLTPVHREDLFRP